MQWADRKCGNDGANVYEKSRQPHAILKAHQRRRVESRK